MVLVRSLSIVNGLDCLKWSKVNPHTLYYFGNKEKKNIICKPLIYSMMFLFY